MVRASKSGLRGRETVTGPYGTRSAKRKVSLRNHLSFVNSCDLARSPRRRSEPISLDLTESRRSPNTDWDQSRLSSRPALIVRIPTAPERRSFVGSCRRQGLRGGLAGAGV